MGRNKRGLQEINAGSMADIAFLLLIFFLVTTTMDVDEGISTKLPPWDPELIEDPPPIRQKNLFVVLVNANDQLLVEDEYMTLDELRDAAKLFLDNNGDGSCEYCQGRQNPSSSVNPQAAIISLQNDRRTSYNMYISVQNELVAAYNELRDELSNRLYGKDYKELSQEQQKTVKEAYPQKISEAEPLDI